MSAKIEKGTGFDKKLKFRWLDAAASMCAQGLEPLEARSRLDALLSSTLTGPKSRSNTLGELTAVWLSPRQEVLELRSDALALWPTLESSEQRLWLHYGMLLAHYPVFRTVTASIGRIARTQNTVTLSSLRDATAGEYGGLGGLAVAMQSIAASLLDWGVLMRTARRGEYGIRVRCCSAPDDVQRWLLRCALFAHPSDEQPYDDLVRLPELFPFRIEVRPDALRLDGHFQVTREGGGLVMVNLLPCSPPAGAPSHST